MNPELKKGLLLTDEILEKAVGDWIGEDFAVRCISIGRGHWEQLIPVIRDIILSAIEKKGYGLVKVDEKLREKIANRIIVDCGWDSDFPCPHTHPTMGYEICSHEDKDICMWQLEQADQILALIEGKNEKALR